MHKYFILQRYFLFLIFFFLFTNFVFAQQIETPFSSLKQETVGRVKDKYAKKLLIFVPRGNITFTPVYDEKMIKKMSELVSLEILITEKTRCFSQEKNINCNDIMINDSVMVKTKEEISENKRLTAESIILLGSYKIEDTVESKIEALEKRITELEKRQK
jgi:hypothetical protein